EDIKISSVLADRGLENRPHINTASGIVIRILFLQVPRNRIEVGFRLLQRNAVFQTAKGREPGVIAPIENARLRAQLRQRDQDFSFGQLHLWRKYADDFGWYAIEGQTATNDRWTRTKMCSPQTIAHHGDLR